MSAFDKQTLAHLKKLCRIDCSPEEETILLDKLQRVVDYVGKLDEVDTSGVQPCSFVLRALTKLTLREDIPADLMPREEFLESAPDQIAGMIRVPPVLKSL
ncbi:MAG TPA: Asp-tRNA(Asn)/Glu-tRNA(Gln) amidotransferase subunit GatC [Chlamydiales bacterium]|nr:MAG: hypothetical protein A3F67_10220 [Verrucomicrobia bacterium RIFCSPHIGHO2_12_FULL_41_10]HLB52993.1 Asp-tRNA(Asn)/Glu-tRNA(Gln) amidotransferase subunit GatC [Chlamydiales bacterium]